MPSLRRTSSSPGVRSSPYSSALNGVQSARSHRRSSGSDTATRRVLADIEWWRVTDGQRDPSAVDQESEGRNLGEAQPVTAAIPSPRVLFRDAQTGVDHPSSILSLPRPAATPASTTEYSLPTAEFAALSLVPQTPLQRHLSLDTGSADSSVESTPEGPSPIDYEGLRLDLEGLEPIFFGDKFTAMLSAPAPSLDRGCLFSDSVFDHDFFDFPASSLLASSFVC